MKNWLMVEDWKEVTHAKTANKKADNFQKIFRNKFDECFPKKTIKMSNEDQPWMTQKLKKLDRQRKRTYHKYRRSPKWTSLDKQFKIEMKVAKANFYTKMVADAKEKDPSKWYKAVKKLPLLKTKVKNLQLKKSVIFQTRGSVN